jgi:hypothetical protein
MRRKSVIIWIVVLAGLASFGAWVCSWAGEKPVISVDYVAKFNEARQPTDYRPEDDGMEMLDEALTKTTNLSVVLSERGWLYNASDDRIDEVRGWIEANKEATSLYEHGLAKRYIFWKKSANTSAAGAVGQRMDECWVLARVLMLRGELKAMDGDTSGGLQDAAAGGQMAVIMGKCPMLHEWRTSRSIEQEWCRRTLAILAHGKPTAKDLDDTAAAISHLPDINDVLDEHLKSERYSVYDMMQRFFTDDGKGDGRVCVSVGEVIQYQDMGQEVRDLWGVATQPGRKETVKKFEETQLKARELAAMEPWQIRQKGVTASMAISKAIEGNMFLGIMREWSELTGVYQNSRIARTGTQATVAVLRYKMDAGRLPVGWDEVVQKGYLRAAPIDGYSGVPLVYRRMDSGFEVYSAGPNYRDDGCDKDEDIVFWPVEKGKSLD